MKEYFYLTGKDQNGPFTIEELKSKGLTSETLVWFDGIENWKKIKDLPELVNIINIKKVPPPPPVDGIENNVTRTEVSGQLKITTEKQDSKSLQYLKPSKNEQLFLISWFAFHLFALITSYSQLEIFNNRGKPQADKFWPFVSFYRTEHAQYASTDFTNANGFFTEYDLTEFLVYVIGAMVIYLILKTSDKKM